DVITIETSRSDMELLTAFGEFKYPNDIGPGNSSALTMVERSTNLGIIRKLAKNKTTQEVSKAVTEALRHIKDAVHTITTDNGPEFMQYEDIEKSLGWVI
ncbi:MAG: hypothetical protein ACFNVW_11275, partial [Segatella oris]